MGFGLAARLALRGLKRDTATSLSAVGILALGLAAPATFFSLLWGGGLRPLPVPEGDRIVRIDVRQPTSGGAVLSADAEDMAVLAQSTALESLGAFETGAATLVVEGTGALSVSSAAMTPQAFHLLREQPAIGRLPEASEAGSTVVLGHELWAELFESDPDALGRFVRVDGVDRTVIAVMPEGFEFPFSEAVWTVVAPSELSGPVELFGRLAEGADREAAQLELGALWTRRDVVRSAERSGGVVRVQGFTHGRGEGGEAMIFGGLVLVGLCLLLIACVNAANLLLVRAADRVQMLGVQSALGAPRRQIAAQLFLEALALSALGGLAGLWLASLMVEYVQTTMGPQNFGYYWMRVAVDGPVVALHGRAGVRDGHRLGDASGRAGHAGGRAARSEG